MKLGNYICELHCVLNTATLSVPVKGYTVLGHGPWTKTVLGQKPSLDTTALGHTVLGHNRPWTQPSSISLVDLIFFLFFFKINSVITPQRVINNQSNLSSFP